MPAIVMPRKLRCWPVVTSGHEGGSRRYFLPSQSCSSRVTTLLTSVDLLRLDSQCSRCTRWYSDSASPAQIVADKHFLDQKLISYRYSSCSCSCSFLLSWGFKKVIGSVVSNRIGMKFGRNVHHVNTHRLTESDFRLGVTRWRPWRHFTQKSVAAWWVNEAYARRAMQQHTLVPDL